MRTKGGMWGWPREAEEPEELEYEEVEPDEDWLEAAPDGDAKLREHWLGLLGESYS